jgi:hypothetical protein
MREIKALVKVVNQMSSQIQNFLSGVVIVF